MSLIRTARWASNYFAVFPKTYPRGGPPRDPFTTNLRALRREYRVLQSKSHPDRGDTAGESDVNQASADINQAYATLKNPYGRAAHVIALHHPEKWDINSDAVAKSLIAQFQSDPANLLDYKNLLMVVLEAHEQLELAATEADLKALALENDARIEKTLEVIEQLLAEEKWDSVLVEAIRMKYWVNIANAIKEWEPGKPVQLTH